MDRRSFLALTGKSSQFLLAAAVLGGCGGRAPSPSAAKRPSLPPGSDDSVLARIGSLGEPDAHGIRLPAGFSSRIVANSGEPVVAGSSYRWHPAPDGGAVFARDGGGWIYVSNSELDRGKGGVGALVFDAEGSLVDAYSILEGTDRNCAGGATPWHTWLSCEEVARGRVFECDPFGRLDPVERPALGRFWHEAVAVDPSSKRLYLTEDKSDGGWYRFTPDSVDAGGRADLSAGLLEIATGNSGVISWVPVPDPSAARTPTRYQVPGSAVFNGGEGTAYHDGFVYFTTKGDDRVWGYEIDSNRLFGVYDAALSQTPILGGADNLAVSRSGDLLVAEDGDDMQIVVLTPGGAVLPLLQVVGHPWSEVTGPAFSPDYRRLYFSSQRGATGRSSGGITYEISGPFTGAL